MSRSFKRHPFCKDRNSAKWGKRYCNKRVRKTIDIPNGRSYRKLTEPWDFIYDYSDSMTWEEYKHYYKNESTWYKAHWEGDDKEYWNWYKIYKRK